MLCWNNRNRWWFFCIFARFNQSGMYLIDTHTHLYDPAFDLDRPEAVQRALDAGVGMLLLPNVDASTIDPMLEMHEQFPDCTRMMMGLQPEEVKADYKQVLAVMEKALEKPSYIGVGEIGLDFYWDASFEKEQLDATFSAVYTSAGSNDSFVITHTNSLGRTSVDTVCTALAEIFN